MTTATTAPVGEDLTVKSAVYDTAFAPFAPPRVASLSFAGAALVEISIVVIAMYRRRLFLKL